MVNINIGRFLLVAISIFILNGANSVVAQSCPLGDYYSGGVCNVCPTGYFCPSGATSPTACTANYYCYGTGLSAATACTGTGFTSPAGSSSCTSSTNPVHVAAPHSYIAYDTATANQFCLNQGYPAGELSFTSGSLTGYYLYTTVWTQNYPTGYGSNVGTVNCI